MKDLTLARKVYEENKSNFQSTEQARSFIRIIRGHNGKYHFKHLADKSNVKPLNYDTTNSPRPFKEKIETSAKVLILDIETAPIRAYVWGIWNQNVSLNQIQSDWFCLTWAAKWLFEDKVYSGKLTPKEVKKQDDKRIIKGVWELLNEADLVIAHNGERFDLPKLNARFIINDLHPPLPYQSIDTLKHIRRQFGFTSNKLDYVNKLLNLERKTDTGGFELWERCMLGEQAALDEMEGYNINDVRILEETYLHIRPWIKPHPNMGLFILDENQHRCPSCGSADLIESGKGYYTTVNIYASLRCNNCGATARKRVAEVNIKQRRFVLQSSPK
jgi:DNA polymerase elongation subunit (family B)